MATVEVIHGKNTVKMLKNHHRTRNHGGMSLKQFARALASDSWQDGLSQAAKAWLANK